MAQLIFKLTINKQWLKESTDLSHCHCCGEHIYSEMFRLWLTSKSKSKKVTLNLIGHKTQIVLCESCYNLLDNDN